MRTKDIIVATLDHLDHLAAAKTTRASAAVYRMARRAFVRGDYASWFERQFGHAIEDDRDALAGLLLGFGLAVHSRFPYKRLAVSPRLSVIAERWADPAPHPHPEFSRYILSEGRLCDFAPYAEGAVWVTPPPRDCQFLGIYCAPDSGSPDLSAIGLDIVSVRSTACIIAPLAVMSAVEPWFDSAEVGTVIRRPFGPGADLELLYYSNW